MTNLEKLINDAKEDFISKFTVWNDKYRYATLEGKEEYPTPDMIANWWEKKLIQTYNEGNEELKQTIIEKIEEYAKSQTDQHTKYAIMGCISLIK